MHVLFPVVLVSVACWPVLWPELTTNDSPLQTSSSAAASKRPTVDLRRDSVAPMNNSGEAKQQAKPRIVEVPVHAKVKPEAGPAGKQPATRTSPIVEHPAPGPDYEAREYPGSPTGWGWFLKSSPVGRKPGRWEQQRRCNGTTCSIEWVWRED